MCCVAKPVNTKEPLIKSFDRLRTNGNLLIPFVVSLSNHERNQLNQRFPKLVHCEAKRFLLTDASKNKTYFPGAETSAPSAPRNCTNGSAITDRLIVV